jgi:CBS-domain-containing membrane protein
MARPARGSCGRGALAESGVMVDSIGAVPVEQRDMGEIDLSDADIVDAMVHVPGYLDISTEDFRALYHLAHHNALDRMLSGVRAATLMHPAVSALSADMPMDQAARTIVESGYKGLPVLDPDRRVIGMLTETDFLKRMNADTFLELMLRLISDNGELGHRCHETRVELAMTTPATVVETSADFRSMLDAFHRHPGRSMPVVDGGGRLAGILLREDLLAALHLDAMP